MIWTGRKRPMQRPKVNWYTQMEFFGYYYDDAPGWHCWRKLGR